MKAAAEDINRDIYLNNWDVRQIARSEKISTKYLRILVINNKLRPFK